MWYFSLNLKEGKDRCPSTTNQVGGVPSHLKGSAFLFHYELQLIERGPPTLEKAIGFIQSTNLNLNLTPNIFSGVSRVIIEQISGHPISQSC